MATSDLVPRRPAERRVSREIARLQERNATLAVREDADAADHRRRAALVATTGLRTAEILSITADGFRDLTDGDPLKASIVSPILDDVVTITRHDFRRTFGA